MLNLLDLRVIVNDTVIYYLKPGHPLLLRLAATQPLTMVFSNGFHITQRLHVPVLPGTTARLVVGCLLDDHWVVALFLLTGLLFVAGVFSGFYIVQLVSFVPVLCGLYLFYGRRKAFLQVRFFS